MATVLDDTNVIRLNVYNGNENTEKTIVNATVSMGKSGYPVSISLTPNGKIMAVSYLYVDSGNMSLPGNGNHGSLHFVSPVPYGVSFRIHTTSPILTVQ